MIHYVIQVLLFQMLFLTVYDLFLKNETFFQWNRAYLIITSILAYAIPFIKSKHITTYVQQNFTVLPEIVLNSEVFFLTEVSLSQEKTNWFTLENFYYFGIVIASLLFLYKITRILNKIYKNTIIKQKEYNLVILPMQKTAFSFFNYLFLGKSIFETEHQHIIKHELIHIKEKHSIDLMYFELQKIAFWFNPFSYLFQHRISTLHEFIADSETIKQEDKKSFFEGLLEQTFQVEKFAFVNQYKKKSLLKKRIIMATKSKSKEIFKLKYLLLIPLLTSMLIYTSCETETHVEKQSFEYKELDKKPFLVNSKKTTNKEQSLELIKSFFKISYDNVIDTDENGYYPLKFILNKNGDITNIDYAGIPEKYLSNAKEIIRQLPEMNSGKINDKAVNTKMMIMLTKRAKKTREIYETEEVPFSVIDQVPIYPGCENMKNLKAKKCMADKITELVSTNFNTNLANNLNLSSGKKRISVQFKIDKNGNVTEVKSRAPHPKLKEEAIRVIKLIPKMKAGEQNGKPIKVRYNLPIVFNVKDNNYTYLEGIIDDKFGYLSYSKKSLATGVIEALDYNRNKKYKVISFQLKIENEKTIAITGNRLNAISKQKINQLKPGNRIKILNIKAETKNTYVEDIVIKINNL